jgi:hypothetical protein
MLYQWCHSGQTVLFKWPVWVVSFSWGFVWVALGFGWSLCWVVWGICVGFFIGFHSKNWTNTLFYFLFLIKIAPKLLPSFQKKSYSNDGEILQTVMLCFFRRCRVALQSMIGIISSDYLQQSIYSASNRVPKRETYLQTISNRVSISLGAWLFL